MTWYTLFFLIALLVCMASLTFHLVLLIKSGNTTDYAPPSGSIKAGIQYSFTGAMSPLKKESAFLHLPTYTAGIIYHIGTFISVFLIFILWADVIFPPALSWGLASFMLVSALCGIGILFKRMIKKGLRELSNPDDYISNVLVTVFQILTGLTLLFAFSKFAHAFYRPLALFFQYRNQA
jgi:nitrate reductase gamma subunit